jgi:inner membrane transporter RhtA
VTTKRDRAIGAGTQFFTEVSINFGSALAGVVIPLVGVVAVVTARQVMTAIFVLPFYRPKLRDLR